MFEKHIVELEKQVEKKSKKSKKMGSDYASASKHSTRVSNQSSIIQQSKFEYEKIRKEFEDKFGYSAPRSKNNFSQVGPQTFTDYNAGSSSVSYHSVKKLVHMDSEIDLNPSSSISDRGNENLIQPPIHISKRPGKK